MESRQSARADGRGWGARGDSGPRWGASRGDGPAGEPAPNGPRAAWPPASDSAEGPLREDERLRGPGESPWVRSGEPGPRAGERSGAPPRSTPPLPDLSALLLALEGMRGMVPRELSSQAGALLRELLLTLRALIDWYLERLEGRPREPEVEEIPID